jgi:glycosyltransferase involved in cell wall biosynthesis
VTPLRVVFYCDTWEVGGAEANLRNLLAALGSRIVPAIVATDADVGAYLAAARPDAELVLVPRVVRKHHFRDLAAHRRALRGLRPDVVHVSLNEPWSSHWGIVLARAAGAKVVAVENLVTPGSRKQRLVKRLTTRLLAAHVAVAAPTADDLAREAGIPRAGIRVIANGVPDVELDPLPRLPGAVVGSIGRLERQKGYDVLVDALPALPDATAVLVGDGAERDALEEQARELDVADRLRLEGWREDARRLLTTFDVFVLPSRLEALPLVLIEALLAGLPVVATDVGSVSELVTPDVGVLVPPEEPQALGAALAALLADPQARATLGSAGRSRALERFTITRVADAFSALYGEVAGSPPAATV